MLSPKDLDLSPARTHPLNHPVRLIRLPARFPHFADNHIGIHTAISPRWELQHARIGIYDGFDANEHVLLGMVQPMAGAAGANHTLELS
jgi:hypothetical protein